ncbi:PAS domain S-box protein [Fontisphaera persica]|uniref:PAS domain S-box protein n=1 Tax=Fontisphaera persica TaxID=2974023 RepID=UPI0024BFBB79|nr:PAS domain S-box protein [Fontisphaera persica]WCJ59021.1 PAS domain S-box protein [Fontisphaera persica]
MPRRILIVEDDAAHAELMRRSLRVQEAEFELVFAATLGEALSKTKTHSPDLIIADRRLPDGLGDELLGHLGFQVPVIILTTFGNEREAVEALRAGAMDYVAKSPEAFARLPHLAHRALREWGYLQDKRRAEDQMRRALERMQRQQQALSRLAVSPAVAEGDLDTLARLVTETGAEVLEVERVSLWLLDEARGELRCHDLFECSLNRHSSGMALTQKEYAREIEALTADPCVCAAEVLTDPRLAGYVENYFKPLGIVSLLDAAIRWQGRVTGILCCETVGEKRAWEADEKTFAVQLADQVALTLANQSRVTTELALRQSEERFRRMVETAHEGIWVVDADERTVFVNRHMAEMLGYAPEQMLGRPVKSFLRAPDHDFPNRQMELRRQGRSSHYECWVRHANGEWRWMDVSASPIFDGQGRFAGALAMMQDATERRQANERLRESESFFRAVWESAREGLRLTDAQGRILLVNEAFCQMFGKSRAEWINHSLAEMYASDEGQRILEKYQQRYQERTLEGINEKELTLWDGRKVWLAVAHTWLDLESTSPRVLSSFRDVTANKRAEQERLEMERKLLFSQKLESLGVLAGGIAHDFNNLLTAILGNLGMAMEEVPADSVAQSCLKAAEEAALRAANLSRQMLAYTGRAPLEMTEVHLSHLMREMAMFLRSSINRNIELDLQLEEDLPLVRADAAQVQQITVNLVTNAAEAIGERNGKIVVRTGFAHCDAARLSRSRLLERPPPGPYVFLEVQDNGCGMTPEVLERLFDPFFTTKFHGRGLGMAFVLGVVRSLKGAILVESQPGAGTTIQVYFPVSRGSRPSPAEVKTDTPATPPPASPPPPERQITVLIVDDEPGVLATAARLVQRGGYKVIMAADGPTAIAQMSQHRQDIQCAIVDLTMPLMDGLTTSQELRKLNPHLTILLSSGYDAQEIRKKAAGFPVHGFLHKPYQMRDIMQKLEEVCRPAASPQP